MQSSPLARPVARCRAAHRPNGPSSPLAEPCRIEHETALFGPAVKQHALRLLGWAAVPIGPCARTCTRPAHGRRARATAGRARAFCCCCCCCSTHPPWRTPTSRGRIRVTRGLEPRSCPRLCAALRTTSERARSPLPALGQASRGFLSAARAGDALRADKHGQQAEVRARRDLRDRGM